MCVCVGVCVWVDVWGVAVSECGGVCVWGVAVTVVLIL